MLVQKGIEKYKNTCSSSSIEALKTEEHKSERLGRHLEEKFGSRPARCHAHAIVAGKHELAAPIRLRMAELKIGIDNGCWLPGYHYYFWLSNRFTIVSQAADFRQKIIIYTA